MALNSAVTIIDTDIYIAIYYRYRLISISISRYTVVSRLQFSLRQFDALHGCANCASRRSLIKIRLSLFGSDRRSEPIIILTQNKSKVANVTRKTPFLSRETVSCGTGMSCVFENGRGKIRRRKVRRGKRPEGEYQFRPTKTKSH